MTMLISGLKGFTERTGYLNLATADRLYNPVTMCWLPPFQVKPHDADTALCNRSVVDDDRQTVRIITS